MSVNWSNTQKLRYGTETCKGEIKPSLEFFP